MAQLRVGVSLDSSWILVGEVSAPVTDETRFLWKTGIGLTYRWGTTMEAKDCGCENDLSH